MTDSTSCKMAPTTCALFVALVLSGSLLVSCDDAIEANIDSLTDNILQGLKNYLPKVGRDQIELPDIETSFEHKILWFTFDGSLQIANGVLKNFYDVTRYNDELLTYEVENGNSSLIVQLGLMLNDLEMSFDLTAESSLGIGNIKNKSTTASVKKAKGTVIVSINLDTFEMTAKELKFASLGNISINVSHAGVEGLLIKILPSILEQLVKFAINKKGLIILQAALDSIDLDSLFPA